MTELAAIAFPVASVLIATLATVAFHGWLRLRERERLTATDRAALDKRLDDVDGRIRELKNTLPRRA